MKAIFRSNPHLYSYSTRVFHTRNNMDKHFLLNGSRNEDTTSSSSGSDDDEVDQSRCKREISQSAFAQALKSSRLQTHRVNTSNVWREGNPNYGTVMLLFCQTGSHLRIGSDGKISGTQDETDPYAVLEFFSAGLPGHIVIRGRASKLYLAMNKNGKLYGEARSNVENVVWLEEILGSYNTYMSRSFAHLGWYLGIKRSRKPKNGKKTGWGQKATKFLPRRL